MNYYAVVRSPDSDYLEHYGILGMKWGIRRFQNPDGSLTEEGRKRYGDILTPDQMKGMIKSYNLRTGKNKKINKKTTFKTSHGTYDYKGRRIDTDTEINDPGAQTKKETKTKGGSKSLSSMSDEELAARVARMKLEIEYKEKYASLNPKKMTLGQQFASNMREELVTQIPKGVAAAIKNGLAGSLTSSKGNNSSDNSNKDNKDNNQQSQQQPKPQQPKPQQPKQQTTPTYDFADRTPVRSEQVNRGVSNAMSHFGYRVAEIKDDPSNARPLFSSSSGSKKSNALFSTNVRDQKVAEIARQNVYNDSFYDDLFDNQRD